jgi:hypothetical protein
MADRNGSDWHDVRWDAEVVFELRLTAEDPEE